MTDLTASTPADNALSRVIWYDPELQQKELMALLDGFATWVYTERVRKAVGKHTLDKLRAVEQDVRERLEADFTLAVVGNFKNGKSTLINALLGAEIVSTNVTPETVTLNQISYGVSHHIEAILVDGGRVAIPIEDLPAERLVPTLESIRGSAAQPSVAQRPRHRELALRQILIDHFNKSELKDLCFELTVQYDDLEGDTLSDKARELIAYMRRRGRTAELIEACYQLRRLTADITTGSTTAPKPSSTEASRLAQRQSKLEQLREVISHLMIEAPVDWLRGISLVDTPGMRDLHGFDEQIRAFLPRCDAIIFVINAKSPLSEEEQNFLQRYVLARDFAKIFFVVNRVDELRTEANAHKVLEYVRSIIGQMFPRAPVFAISASEACEQRESEQALAGWLPLRTAEFERLRASLQESILLNRDVIHLERAVAQTEQMLDDFDASIAYLQRAITVNQEHRSRLITECENRSSELYHRKDAVKLQVHQQLGKLGERAIDWLSDFLTRFEHEAVPSITQVALEDVQRHFQFFLSDVLREAINCCLEAQRPLVLDILANARRSVHGDVEALSALLSAEDSPDPVVLTKLDDLNWSKLDDLHTMVDQSLISIFALAEDLALPVVGMLLQRQKQNEPRRLSTYQQKLREMLPELRESIIAEIRSLHHDLANEIDRQIEQAHEQDIRDALSAVHQAQEHHESGQEEVETVYAICQELLDQVAETRAELRVIRRKLNTSETLSDQLVI